MFLPPCPHCNVLCPLELMPAESTVSCPSCQGTFIPEKRFGDFLVKKRLVNRFDSRLHMGEICGSGTPVILQFLPTEVVGDPDFEQFLGDQVARLSSIQHPNLAPLAGYLYACGECCLAWEVPEGFSLDTLFDSGRRMAESQVLGFLQQLSHALDTAHSAGLFHGSISPACIFLSNKSIPILVGLGFHYVQESHVSGSPRVAMYLAPEYSTGEVGLPADYYGLGEILYQALVGHPLFRLPKGYSVEAFWDAKHRKAWIPELIPPISKSTERIVQGLLEVDPSARTCDSAALIEAARQAQEDLKVGFSPRVAPHVMKVKCSLGKHKPASKPKSVPWAAICGISAGLLAIALAAVFWILPRSAAPDNHPSVSIVAEPTSAVREPPEPEVHPAQSITAEVISVATPEATVAGTAEKIR